MPIETVVLIVSSSLFVYLLDQLGQLFPLALGEAQCVTISDLLQGLDEESQHTTKHYSIIDLNIRHLVQSHSFHSHTNPPFTLFLVTLFIYYNAVLDVISIITVVIVKLSLSLSCPISAP